MLGAILGDIVGSPYEFDKSDKIKDFGPLFISRSRFTDDSVMTIAVADALMKAGTDADEKTIKKELIESLKEWARKYPYAGYGGRFWHWVSSRSSAPYGSWGNGSAMRVSSAGWLYDSLERTREVARWTAEVTHNHPDAVKGAEAVATAIFLLRNCETKKTTKEFIRDEFRYDFSRTCDEIRPSYKFDVSCQGTVPEAFTAFFEGENFEDVVRTAVSLGGDCDTLTCIACGIAEACYGIPEDLKNQTINYLKPDMQEVYERFLKSI